jgi:hypothetical protein
MFETTPPQPAPDSFDPDLLAGDLADPLGGVIAVELSRRFVRLCLSWSEPMAADLAAQEVVLRQPGGADLAERMLAQRLYQRIDPQVFRLVRVCVPLIHAEFTLSRIEEMLRVKFGEVVQMGAVAITMAGREVQTAVAAMVADTHLAEGDR